MSSLTSEQLAALGSGKDFWSTKEIGDIPSIFMTDGPHGVRKQMGVSDNLGILDSHPATCFPPAVCLSQTWDPDLAREVGEALADECRSLDVDVLLGPGINIKRDPRGGRNFEYFSEDPFLTAEMATPWIMGVQSKGVGTSLKHFAVNNAEFDRLRISSDVDERTLREIYLRAFEKVVRRAQPWTVMCAYNAVNGVLASQNHWLLTQVLREEWGFDGVVVSDWGAVADRVSAVRAGLDLQMPADGGASDAEVVTALKDGTLDPSFAEQAANRVQRLTEHVVHGRTMSDGKFDSQAHHDLAVRAASEGIVLLKNDGDILPLNSGGKVAVIGEFAQTPRFQGGGSSHVAPTQLPSPFSEIQRRIPGAYFSDAASAADSDIAVLFLGVPEEAESEGYDRTSIDLPASQRELLSQVLAVQPNVAVVLMHGGVLSLGPLADVPAILDATLPGQGGGTAIAQILAGEVNPSGKLTETIPQRLEDVPAFTSFPGEYSRVVYGEKQFVGYRWYDKRAMDVAYPFGHGLSYTTFGYSQLSVSSDDDGVSATFIISNTGSRAGREIAQLYIGVPDSSVERAVRELKGFASVELEAGASAVVTIRVPRQELAYWDPALSQWVVEGGSYHIAVGTSSRILPLNARVTVVGDSVIYPITLRSTIGELAAHPKGQVALQELAESVGGILAVINDDSSFEMLKSFPLGRLASLTGGAVSTNEIQQLIASVNN